MTAPLSSSDTIATVRLLPKANARAIRHGFPWVYANEMVLDRRTKKLAPGSLARLEDANRAPLGLVAVNPNSKIIARMLDPDPEAGRKIAEVLGNARRALPGLYDRALPAEGALSFQRYCREPRSQSQPQRVQ